MLVLHEHVTHLFQGNKMFFFLIEWIKSIYHHRNNEKHKFFVRGIHSCEERLKLKTWGFHSVYGGKIDIKELRHVFFQESNSRNCHQTDWNIKIVTQKLSESITSDWELFLYKKLLALSSIALKEW